MPRGTTSPPPASLYNFRENAVLGFKNADSADAQIIGESIAAIKAANNNRLQPRFVFEAARSQRHPLHRHFEWNVQKAAEAHWLDTARRLIRAVVIVNPEEPDAPTRAWVSVEDEEGTSFHSSAEIRASLDLQLAVMRRALRDLEAWQQRYRELSDICSRVEEARRLLAERVAEREREATAGVGA